jgi:hypothetical protein
MVGLAPEIAERRTAAIATYEAAVKEAREQMAADKLAITIAHDLVFNHARNLLEQAKTDQEYLEAKAQYDEARIRPAPSYETAQAKCDKTCADAAQVLHEEIAMMFGRSL